MSSFDSSLIATGPFFIYIYIYSCTCSIQKFLGQWLNQCCSWGLCYNHSHNRSLTSSARPGIISASSQRQRQVLNPLRHNWNSLKVQLSKWTLSLVYSDNFQILNPRIINFSFKPSSDFFFFPLPIITQDFLQYQGLCS